MKQKTANGIIRDEDIGQTVTVHVGESDSHSLPDVPSNPGGVRDIAEHGVVIVVEQLVGQALIGVRMTIVLPLRRAAAGFFRGIPHDVVRDKQIEPAIVVVV
jgi:hypothetical protein